MSIKIAPIIILAVLIGIVGLLGWQYFDNPPTVDNIEDLEKTNDQKPLVQEEKPADLDELTADWKDYNNKDFGFGLKYPDVLAYKYDSVFEPDDSSKKKIFSMPLGEEPFQVWVTVNATNALPTTTEDNLLEQKKIDVDGAETIRKTFRQKGILISAAGFEKDGKIFSVWAEINGQEEERLKIFKNLLFTFHF